MFAPISFGYMYDCIEQQETEDSAPVTLELLTTVSNIANVLVPAVIGIFWNRYFPVILMISVSALVLAIIAGAKILPSERTKYK